MLRAFMTPELDIPRTENIPHGPSYAKLKNLFFLLYLLVLAALAWQTDEWAIIVLVAVANIGAHVASPFIETQKAESSVRATYLSNSFKAETAIQLASNGLLVALIPVNTLTWVVSLVCIWRAPFRYAPIEASVNLALELLVCVGLLVLFGYEPSMIVSYFILAGTAFALSSRMISLIQALYGRIGDKTNKIERMNDEKAKLVMEAREFRRLASMGQLAAGIAHEINNPLTYVISNLEYASRSLQSRDDKDAEILRALDDAAQGAERVRYIVRDVKSFSRSDERNLQQEVDLNEVILASLNIMKSQVRQTAIVETKFGNVPTIRADKASLGQVFVNLLANAAQAIDPTGVRENKISIVTKSSEGLVHAEVTDTGSGIEAQIMERIFEPFFTSKPLGIGTGLGLSIVKQIVEVNSGTISVTSEPDQGTTFRVSFPAVDLSKADPVTGSYTGGLRSFPKIERILIVDDDASLLAGLSRQFHKCKVVTASSGQEALTILQNDEHYDAILCDLTMPLMSGVEFYEELIQQRPPMQNKIVFMTGGAFTPQVQAFLDQDWIRCLGKPFTWPDLLRVLMLPGTPDEMSYREELSSRPPRVSSGL